VCVCVCAVEQKVFQIKTAHTKTQTANKASKKFQTVTKKPRKREGKRVGTAMKGVVS